MSTNTTSFDDFMKGMDILMNSLNDMEKEVNNDEVEEIKEVLKKYDVVLNNDTNEQDLILKYKTFYNQTNEFVNNKKKQIKDVEEKVKCLGQFANDEKFLKILNKKKSNVDQIINCINRIVERIKELETSIYNNKKKELNGVNEIKTSIYNKRMKELDDMKVEIYGEIKSQIKPTEVQQPIQSVDKQLNVINKSMGILKKWSKRDKLNIIFDSDIDGDGRNNGLHDKVFGRSNLYFISFDENNNVFGGYVNEKINISDDCIDDKNAFVFSLIRDGLEVNNKYPINKKSTYCAFRLCDNDPNDQLYSFGLDIVIHNIGNYNSQGSPEHYNCNYVRDPVKELFQME
ncbi:TLDc domain-containing protein [Entamoeba marina]